MKKIVIINGHPDRESFCHALQLKYKEGALEVGNEVEEIPLSDLKFNPILKYGYRKRVELEPDLLHAWELIKQADHIVWLYPTWWGTVPSLLKGFIDRMFLPGFAYEYLNKSLFPEKLLDGKTSEIISTMDTPVWYYKLFYKDIGGRMLRKNIGAFCGLKNIRTTYLATIKGSTPDKRKIFLNRVKAIAKKVK